MKKSCLFFDKKIQMCMLHSPLHRPYLNSIHVSQLLLLLAFRRHLRIPILPLRRRKIIYETHPLSACFKRFRRNR